MSLAEPQRILGCRDASSPQIIIISSPVLGWPGTRLSSETCDTCVLNLQVLQHNELQ